ncbi:MAG: DUF2520 domain-containing protein [Actinomycetales bacterium]|nr:DUF2520 domain-containing protein [Actinomycetales bacterium]
MPARLKVAIIGTGRVGSVLGAALARAGHPVIGATAISEISKLRAESLLPGVPIRSIDEVAKDADLLLLTVPDDALPDLVAGLAQTSAVSPGTFVVHTAGRFSDEVLDPLTKSGCLPIALHPVMTFTGTSIDLTRLAGCAFGVTAPDQLRAVADALVVEMGGEPTWVPRESRALYHAAISFGANNLMTLVNQSIDLLAQAGIVNPTNLVAPLFSAALDNALRSGDQTITGPVARADVATIRAHMTALAQVSPEVVPSYLALARLTANRAIESGSLDAPTAQRLLEVLANE